MHTPLSGKQGLFAVALALLVSTPALATAETPAETPPGYGPSRRAATPTDGWGRSDLTNPYAFRQSTALSEPPMRRDAKMAGAGGVLMGAGFVTFLAGVGVAMDNTECKTVIIFPSCHTVDQGTKTAAEAMMVGGVLTLVVGIPVLVMGLQKRPVAANTASLAGAPSATGWTWRF